LREVVESLPDKVNVLDSGGVVDGVFKTKEQIKNDEVLTGRSFISNCTIPDVHHNTKILGICGIPDNKMAAPAMDGSHQIPTSVRSF